MSYRQSLIERRKAVRVSARGEVIMHGGGTEIRGRGVVVSATALEVHCEPSFDVAAMAGAPFDLEMRLDGTAGAGFAARGTVSRLRPATNSLVIELGALPEALARLVADATTHTRASPLEVLVVDHDAVRRTHVSDAFRAEGCHVVETGSTSEALDALTGATFATEVIAVADTTPESAAVDLRDYLDRAYGAALLVGVGDADWLHDGPRLDPSDPEGLLRERVRALLLLTPAHGPALTRSA